MTIDYAAPAAARLDKVTARVQQACAWLGPLLLAVFLLAFIVLCDMWPPPEPSWPGVRIQEFYLQHTNIKRVGIAICLAAWALMLPWGVGLASFTAGGEGGFRILSVIQAASAAATMAMGELMLLLWGVNTFRPSEFSAESMQMFNDLGWFIFVIYWAPGVVWCWSLGTAILVDGREEPVFPRWVAYLNFWTGFSFFPASLALFFKTGAFAYDGVLAIWLPAGIFFLWYGVMSVLMIKASKRALVRCREHTPASKT